jgi:hypothetical protein
MLNRDDNTYKQEVHAATQMTISIFKPWVKTRQSSQNKNNKSNKKCSSNKSNMKRKSNKNTNNKSKKQQLALLPNIFYSRHHLSNPATNSTFFVYKNGDEMLYKLPFEWFQSSKYILITRNLKTHFAQKGLKDK